MPGKTPVQARERVGLTRCSNRSDRLAIRRSPARTGWSDELFSRVPQCRRRLRAMLNFEGRNCRGRLHGHADAHAPTRRQIAPEGKAPYWPPDLVIDPQKKAPPKRGFFGGHMHGLDHSPRIHNAETRVWFRGFVQYAREGPGSGKDTRASPTSVCGDPGGAIRRSLRARKRGRARAPFASFARRSAIRERSKRPQCDTAGDHRRGFVHPRKSPAETGPIRAARLEEYHPAAFNFIPKYVRSQRKSPAETGAKWVMLAAPPLQ